MNLNERIAIQVGLKAHHNFTQIGDDIGKPHSTISREVKSRRYQEEEIAGNVCAHRKECSLKKIREKCNQKNSCMRVRCRYKCGVCNKLCTDFEKEICLKPQKAPFVCNGCSELCNLKKWKYDATKAHINYRTELSESRKGISLTENQLDEMDKIVSPLIRQGQSIPVIYKNHADKLPVSAKTIYSYVENGLFDIGNLDLRLRVKRRPNRKKTGPNLKVDKKCIQNRTYEDYLTYISENPDETISQMDTVEGTKGGKVILTILFTNCGLQLMYIRDRNNAASVTAIFESLHDKLGASNFEKLFQVILTDRGSEFSDPTKIEINKETEQQQCHVFYCDPQRSDQKGECEKNHVHIRYVIPKGKSMDHLKQVEINLLMNHINSYARAKWNWKAPIDIFKEIYGTEILEILELEKIDPDSVNLTPSLLK